MVDEMQEVNPKQVYQIREVLLNARELFQHLPYRGLRCSYWSKKGILRIWSKRNSVQDLLQHLQPTRDPRRRDPDKLG